MPQTKPWKLFLSSSEFNAANHLTKEVQENPQLAVLNAKIYHRSEHCKVLQFFGPFKSQQICQKTQHNSQDCGHGHVLQR
jgi:hypothetical protein